MLQRNLIPQEESTDKYLQKEIQNRESTDENLKEKIQEVDSTHEEDSKGEVQGAFEDALKQENIEKAQTLFNRFFWEISKDKQLKQSSIIDLNAINPQDNKTPLYWAMAYYHKVVMHKHSLSPYLSHGRRVEAIKKVTDFIVNLIKAGAEVYVALKCEPDKKIRKEKKELFIHLLKCHSPHVKRKKVMNKKKSKIFSLKNKV